MNQLGRQDIERRLRNIGRHLSSPRRFTLFGGCAMSHLGLKTSTIDIDAFVEPSTEYANLIADLRRSGWDYDRNEAKDAIEPQDRRPALDGMEQWWSGEQSGYLDLFPRQRLWHKLVFSQAMEARVKSWFTEGLLEVQVADASTVLLLKAVTGRWHHQPGRDLEDIATMHARGAVDWDFVEAEWHWQVAHGAGRQAVANAREAFDMLLRQGHMLPWQP